MSDLPMFRRLAVTGLTATALSFSPLAVGVGAAAPALYPTECDQRGEFYVVDGTWKDTLLGAKGHIVGGGQERVLETSIKYTREVATELSVHGNWSGGVDAAFKFVGASIEATYGIAFKKEERRTVEETYTQRDTVNPKKTTEYAAFVGSRMWSGTWNLNYCNSQYKVEKRASGRWSTVLSTTRDGLVPCPGSKYDYGSLERVACEKVNH